MSSPQAKRRASNRRNVCFGIAAVLHAKLPRPYNFASYLGWGLRKLRLADEIEAYDALRRDQLGRHAGRQELRCLGELLLEACDGEMPLDGGGLIKASSFEKFRKRSQARLAAQLNAKPEEN